eukprot:8116793-Pyramimonas_sp.AAC.1
MSGMRYCPKCPDLRVRGFARQQRYGGGRALGSRGRGARQQWSSEVGGKSAFACARIRSMFAPASSAARTDAVADRRTEEAGRGV